jgi:hypothetical protein
VQDNNPQPSISRLQFLFNAGDSPYGTLIVAAVVVLIVWGLVNLVVRNRNSIVAQVFLSYLPLVMALCGSLSAYQEFTVLATSEIAPKPSELGRVMSLAIACGILGSVGTLVPGMLGVIALMLHPGNPRTEVHV